MSLFDRFEREPNAHLKPNNSQYLTSKCHLLDDNGHLPRESSRTRRWILRCGDGGGRSGQPPNVGCYGRCDGATRLRSRLRSTSYGGQAWLRGSLRRPGDERRPYSRKIMGRRRDRETALLPLFVQHAPEPTADFLQTVGRINRDRWINWDRQKRSRQTATDRGSPAVSGVGPNSGGQPGPQVWLERFKLNCSRGRFAGRLPRRNRRGYIPIIAAAVTRRSG